MTPRRPGAYVIGMVLAIGLCTALNLLVFAVCYDAVMSAGPGLSENATQILTGWGGGIVGVIGSLLGYQAGIRGTEDKGSEPPPWDVGQGVPRGEDS
jgi:hypothetical protein